ncbi:MAG: enoyl-CoA hydratase-related protein [Acidimicrobiia bacterium]
MAFLGVERRDRIAVLTLDDPDRRNAMSGAMVKEMTAAFDELETDAEIGAAVITGAPPAFCSGADRADLATGVHDVRSIYEGFLRVRRSSLPTVAAVNGPAVGAGCNLALACDVRLASPAARFDPRFLKLGLHPGGGHTWMLERLGGPQTAAAMVLFDEVLEGEQAATRGLAWRCVPEGALVDEAVALAGRAADAPGELVARIKDTLGHLAWMESFDDAVAAELDAQQWSFGQPWRHTEPSAPKRKSRTGDGSGISDPPT